jgi:EF hand domain-containing protein
MVASLGVAFAACAPGTKTEAAPASTDVKPEYDKGGRLKLLTYDRNGDGKIDTWGYMDGSHVVRVEIDENGDGKVDTWEYHRDPKEAAGSGGSPDTGDSTASNASSPSGKTANGTGGDITLERIDRATKFDGRINRHEYFEHGVLTRVEEDADGDGKVDKWETYSAGTLVSMAIDTKGRGIPDRRLIYLPDGTFSRIETDPSGSGTWRPLAQ